jgi:hypothetical protein
VRSTGATGQQREGRRARAGTGHRGGKVAAAEPRGDVARAREGQGGGARAVVGVQVPRGVCPSRRWRQGEAGVAMSGSDDRRQRSRGAEQVPEEEEEGKGSE